MLLGVLFLVSIVVVIVVVVVVVVVLVVLVVVIKQYRKQIEWIWSQTLVSKINLGS